MYNKKYIIEKIEEFNGHNPIYDGVEGRIAYPAYFNVGERGWFLYEADGLDSWFTSAHRIHTSIVNNIEYFDNMAYCDDYFIVETQNTRFTFRLISD